MDRKFFPEEEIIIEDKEHYTPEEIDRIPVYYCAKCMSLHIYREDSGGVPSHCKDCRGTYIKVATDIYEWQQIKNQN